MEGYAEANQESESWQQEGSTPIRQPLPLCHHQKRHDSAGGIRDGGTAGRLGVPQGSMSRRAGEVLARY